MLTSIIAHSYKVFWVSRDFSDVFSSNFQIYNAVLLIIATILYVIVPGLIYFMTRKLYLLTIFSLTLSFSITFILLFSTLKYLTMNRKYRMHHLSEFKSFFPYSHSLHFKILSFLNWGSWFTVLCYYCCTAKVIHSYVCIVV